MTSCWVTTGSYMRCLVFCSRDITAIIVHRRLQFVEGCRGWGQVGTHCRTTTVSLAVQNLHSVIHSNLLSALCRECRIRGAKLLLWCSCTLHVVSDWVMLVSFCLTIFMHNSVMIWLLMFIVVNLLSDSGSAFPSSWYSRCGWREAAGTSGSTTRNTWTRTSFCRHMWNSHSTVTWTRTSFRRHMWNSHSTVISDWSILVRHWPYRTTSDDVLWKSKALGRRTSERSEILCWRTESIYPICWWTMWAIFGHVESFKQVLQHI